MHLGLGGLVKGVTTGLETLAETGNPYIAAGAGAVACLSDAGDTHSPAGSGKAVPTFNPLLDAMSAENPAERRNVNALSTFAQQHQNTPALIDPELAAA